MGSKGFAECGVFMMHPFKLINAIGNFSWWRQIDMAASFQLLVLPDIISIADNIICDSTYISCIIDSTKMTCVRQT